MAVTGAIHVGELEIRPREHVVLAAGHEVALTSREFGIVATLAEHPGWVLSADQLAGECEDADYSPESVSVLVSRLRHKFAAAGVTDAVETVRGLGYRLHPPASPTGETSETGSGRRELRDACWQLQEAALEVEHSGTIEQRLAATDTLVQARHAIYASLAE